MNYKQKKTIRTSQISAAGVACVMVISYSPAMANPTIPDTDDTTWRYQQASQPGWGNLVGSCDTSSTTIYGREAAPNAFGDPALAGYIDAVDAPPVPGHTHFTSCGTWLGGEAADATINGLTVGEMYQMTFYVAGYRPIAEAVSRAYSVGDSYTITVGDESTGIATFNSTEWVEQTFTFTADAESEPVSMLTPGNTIPRSVTHFSIAATAVAVLDTDQDGLTDTQELAAGADIDSPDTDGDGLSDAEEVNIYNTNPIAADSDSDGLDDNSEVNTHNTDPNNADTDSDDLTDGDEINIHNTDPNNADTDGGGLTDGAEVANGTDPLSNNTDDIPEPDADGDGVPDDVEATLGSDPNNTDSDNDGLSDGDEVNTFETLPANPDTDNDGLLDGDEVNTHQTSPTNPDTDNDGLADGAEINTYNTDPNNIDSDGDTLTDGAEVATHNTTPTLADTDGDGLSDNDEVSTFATNPLNPDSDGDGLTDSEEVTTLGTDPNNPDTDGSGISDAEEVTAGTDPLESGDEAIDLDLDKDGIPNLIEGNGDQDADGIPNSLDLDSDNDGIPDIIEAGGLDADNNGTVDNFVDTNNDGLDDAVAAVPLPVEDMDLDGLANFLDSDSDQDGLSDLFEAGGVDADDNGIVDNLTDSNGDGLSDAIAATPLPLTDTDNDASFDFIDLDSDNDGLFDLSEAGGVDADNNGQVDSFLDTDSDGIPDLADTDITQGTDSDGDGIDDSVDASITLGDDVNGNGIDDSVEPDADGDGRAIAVLNSLSLPDADGDGIVDVRDVSIDTPSLITGVSGGFGCSVSPTPTSKIDPLLALLAVASFGLVGRRRPKLQK